MMYSVPKESQQEKTFSKAFIESNLVRHGHDSSRWLKLTEILRSVMYRSKVIPEETELTSLGSNRLIMINTGLTLTLTWSQISSRKV